MVSEFIDSEPVIYGLYQNQVMRLLTQLNIGLFIAIKHLMWIVIRCRAWSEMGVWVFFPVLFPVFFFFFNLIKVQKLDLVPVPNLRKWITLTKRSNDVVGTNENEEKSQKMETTVRGKKKKPLQSVPINSLDSLEHYYIWLYYRNDFYFPHLSLCFSKTCLCQRSTEQLENVPQKQMI